MKNVLITIFLLAATLLAANPTYWPVTTLAESGVTSGNAFCDFALLGVNTVLGATNRSEFVAARLYHASGNLTTPSVDQRFIDYGISEVPTVYFNGDFGITGPATAYSYQEVVDGLRFDASPLRINIDNWNPAAATVAGTVTMYDPELSFSGYNLTAILVEDNVGAATNVARQVVSQALSLSGAGDTEMFSLSFSYDPSWVVGNLWAIVLVQNGTQHILQSASTQAKPTYLMRAAMDWDNHDLVSDPNTVLLSNPLWFYNLGAMDNVTLQIVVDEAPGDWYFNYCDEDNNCYPGSLALPITLAPNDTRAFHLNISVGSTGIARFHYLMSSANLGQFIVPFTCRTSDYVDNDDSVLQPAVLLGANYPNPFRGGTAFAVNADKAGVQASVQVFNLKGQLVAETPAQSLAQGANSIVWNAPADLPSGIYFYRLKGVEGGLRRMLRLN